MGSGRFAELNSIEGWNLSFQLSTFERRYCKVERLFSIRAKVINLKLACCMEDKDAIKKDNITHIL